MRWKRTAAWIGIVLAVGWGVWAFRWFTLSLTEREMAYAKAPTCAKGEASPSCRQRLSAAVGGRNKESGGYRGTTTYELTLRTTDASIIDVPVYADTYDTVKDGETVEIERYDGRVTRLVRNGTETTLPERIRTVPSKGKLRAAFAFLLLASVWLVVKSLRARKRELAKLA